MEAILAYTAGSLEPEAQIHLERHLSTCEACRAVAVRQKDVWDALDAWKPSPASEGFDQKLYARISAGQNASWLQRLRGYRWSWALRPALPVAAASAAILLGFLLRQSPTAPVRSEAARAAGAKVSIEQVERALDDMDMLKQMGLTTPAPAGNQSNQPI
jgi:anti-sigma factor RsiW